MYAIRSYYERVGDLSTVSSDAFGHGRSVRVHEIAGQGGQKARRGGAEADADDVGVHA